MDNKKRSRYLRRAAFFLGGIAIASFAANWTIRQNPIVISYPAIISALSVCDDSGLLYVTIDRYPPYRWSVTCRNGEILYSTIDGEVAE